MITNYQVSKIVLLIMLLGTVARRRAQRHCSSEITLPNKLCISFLLDGAFQNSWLTLPQPSNETPKTLLQSPSKSPGRRKCGEEGRGWRVVSVLLSELQGISRCLLRPP